MLKKSKFPGAGKKSLILISSSLLLIFLVHSSVNAQETTSPRFGIKGGVNFSNLYSSDDDHTKMRTGYNLGLFGKFPASKSFSFQPELYYTTKGATVTYKNSFVEGTARFNFNYLEVPLLLVVNVTENFNVHVGPYASFLVSGKVKNESSVDLFDFEENINSDDYNKVDAGIAAGIGIDVGAVGIGARYNYGFTKVGKEKSFLGNTYRFPDAVNGVISLYATLSLL